MQRQWYYINQPACDLSSSGSFFNGSHVPLSTMFYHTPSSGGRLEPFLYCANTLAQLSATFTGSGIDLSDPDSDPSGAPAIKDKLKRVLSFSSMKDYKIVQESKYELHAIVNYENEHASVRETQYGLRPTPIEVGLFDHNQNEYVARETRTHSTGSLLAMRLEERESGPEVMSAVCVEHRLLLSIDRRALVTLSGHLRGPCTDLSVGVDGQVVVHESREAARVVNLSSLSVVTYNIWHNNPPSWIYHDPRERWERYELRLRHLLRSALGAADAPLPEALLMQEVRVDSQFRRPDDPLDGGSQLEHMLLLLTGLLAERRSGYSYQSVYQPMMQLVGRESLCSSRVRNEEGILLLVRSDFEVVDVSSWLLPRYMNDSRDDHQRGVLAATLLRNGQVYDVSTTHLSLFEQSRALSVRALLEVLDERLPAAGLAPVLQVLAGDLNAEPLEDSIATLSSSGLTDLGAASGGGLTFPTDEPAKRIDYVFARRSAAAVSSEATLLGALPTDDSKHLLAPEGERPEYGMLSDTSPLFASDHLGLRVDIL